LKNARVQKIRLNVGTCLEFAVEFQPAAGSRAELAAQVYAARYSQNNGGFNAAV